MEKKRVTEPHAQTPNSIMFSPTLSWKAKALWGYMQAKPAGWNFAVSRIQYESSEGKDSIQAGLNELEDAGLLSRIKTKSPTGKFTTHYNIYLPIESQSNRDGYSGTGFPATENPEINKTIIIKQEIKNNNIIKTNTKKSKTEKIIPIVNESKTRTLFSIVNDYETTGAFDIKELASVNVLDEYELEGLNRLAVIFLDYYVEHKDKVKGNGNTKARFNKFVTSDFQKVLRKKMKWVGIDNITDDEFLNLLSLGYFKSPSCSYYLNVVRPTLNEKGIRKFQLMMRFFPNKTIGPYKDISFQEWVTSKGCTL